MEWMRQEVTEMLCLVAIFSLFLVVFAQLLAFL